MKNAAKRPPRDSAADDDSDKVVLPPPIPPGIVLHRGVPRRNMVNITKLSEDDKRKVWEEIKRRRPALAELLKDPKLHEIRERFNGQILIELD